MTGLTTHVLDLTVGRPAPGVAVRVFAGQPGAWSQTGEARTDADGRAGLLPGDQIRAAAYRLEFEVGPHFRATGASSSKPGFLEIVAIEFTVTDPGAHHHVPLLVTPFAYSTYRGS